MKNAPAQRLRAALRNRHGGWRNHGFGRAAPLRVTEVVLAKTGGQGEIDSPAADHGIFDGGEGGGVISLRGRGRGGDIEHSTLNLEPRTGAEPNLKPATWNRQPFDPLRWEKARS